MLDGRIWWEMRKNGTPEKKEYSDRQVRDTKDWLTERARRKGWL